MPIPAFEDKDKDNSKKTDGVTIIIRSDLDSCNYTVETQPEGKVKFEQIYGIISNFKLELEAEKNKAVTSNLLNSMFKVNEK